MKIDPDTSAERRVCPSCDAADIRRFHEMKNVPVNTVMNSYSREAALAFPRGDIALGFCCRCGFIFNTRFDRTAVKYSSDCEESQGCSPTFSSFARRTARELVEKYGLQEKTIIEIGCGKGEFLKYICSLGRNRGVGFDPVYIPGRSYDEDTGGTVEFVRDFYSDKYTGFHGDLICCRMTLEHIPDTAGLVHTVRRAAAARRDTVVFFQVPDMTRILRDCAFEDIYYEHCSYFSPVSLSRLFQRFGFTILDLQTAYDEQYILLEARAAATGGKRADPAQVGVESIAGLVTGFERRYPAVIRNWNSRLDRYRQESKKVVIWGGGSKGAAFLSAVDAAGIIDYVVDINPFRQQTFMAGTGHPIVAPNFLKEYRPEVVIVMNAIYRAEILHDLNQLGLAPVVTTLKITKENGD
ncbi:MAG: class I SAM-dependent methyltransferase [Desulfobacterales bacterium]